MTAQTFKTNDSILVKDGPHNGWVGYFQQLRNQGEGPYPYGHIEDDESIALVLLMDGCGESRTHHIPIDYLMNLEPYCKSQMYNL